MNSFKKTYGCIGIDLCLGNMYIGMCILGHILCLYVAEMCRNMPLELMETGLSATVLGEREFHSYSCNYMFIFAGFTKQGYLLHPHNHFNRDFQCLEGRAVYKIKIAVVF